MATYTKSKGQSVSGGSDGTFTFEAITIPDSQQFKRCKVEKNGSYLSYCALRGNAQDVFGSNGFDTWSTDKTGINWSKSGDAPKVKVHNSDTTSHAWTLKVTLETEAKPTYAITVTNSTGGTITANKASTYAGDTVTLTVTPASNYSLSSLSVKKTGGSTAVTVSNNKFTMPAYAVTVTATWTQNTFAITKKTNYTGAGTVSGASSALPGASVTITQSQTTAQAAEYRFSGWSISTGSISSGGVFTMPSAAVTVTANYQKRSTATINKTTLKGGDSAVITITPASTAYSHKYRLYKSGNANVDTGWVSVAAGTTAVTVSIRPEWANYVTTAATLTGLTLEVQTYTGSTQIGSNLTVSSSLTYQVPDNAKPAVGTITTAIAHTVGSTTYADVGVYVQGHSGVSVTTSATAAFSATISSLVVSIDGYTGNDYTKAYGSGYTSGLLTRAGTTIIRVTATDSRGLTDVRTAEITVEGYSAPVGTLNVWRVDENGDADDVGSYGKYSMTASLTAVGTNAWTAKTLATPDLGGSATVSSDTGNILPGTRKEFQQQYEYTITLTLQDAFEQTVITATLPSAKFIMYMDAGGDRLGIMGVANKTIPAGKNSTLEISGDTQVYIGSDKLGDAAVHNVANNLTTTDAGSVLDARQGKALNDKIGGINGVKEFTVNAGSSKTITIANNSRIAVFTFGGAAAVCGSFELFSSSTGAIVNSSPTASNISATKTTNSVTIANSNSSVNVVVKMIIFNGSAT